jgi:hypothetical protein
LTTLPAVSRTFLPVRCCRPAFATVAPRRLLGALRCWCSRRVFGFLRAFMIPPRLSAAAAGCLRPRRLLTRSIPHSGVLPGCRRQCARGNILPGTAASLLDRLSPVGRGCHRARRGCRSPLCLPFSRFGSCAPVCPWCVSHVMTSRPPSGMRPHRRQRRASEHSSPHSPPCSKRRGCTSRASTRRPFLPCRAAQNADRPGLSCDPGNDACLGPSFLAHRGRVWA